jgi:hypothetical protein
MRGRRIETQEGKERMKLELKEKQRKRGREK